MSAHAGWIVQEIRRLQRRRRELRRARRPPRDRRPGAAPGDRRLGGARRDRRIVRPGRPCRAPGRRRRRAPGSARATPPHDGRRRSSPTLKRVRPSNKASPPTCATSQTSCTRPRSCARPPIRTRDRRGLRRAVVVAPDRKRVAPAHALRGGVARCARDPHHPRRRSRPRRDLAAARAALAARLDPALHRHRSSFPATSPATRRACRRRSGATAATSPPRSSARCCEAERIDIWTDVDGVLSADPRLVPDAQVVRALSYTRRWSWRTSAPRSSIRRRWRRPSSTAFPIWIRNTFAPEKPGTLICAEPQDEAFVKGITSIDRIALVNLEGAGMIGVPGTAHRLFGALREAGVSVILISQGSSEHSICFAVPEADLERAEHAVRAAFDARAARGADPERRGHARQQHPRRRRRRHGGRARRCRAHVRRARRRGRQRARHRAGRLRAQHLRRHRRARRRRARCAPCTPASICRRTRFRSA